MSECDNGSSDGGHRIRARAVVEEIRRYHPHPTRDGELEFDGTVVDQKTKHRKMFYCTCDPSRNFRTDETALEHLEEHGALDSEGYRPLHTGTGREA